ncbi:transposase, partial [Sphingobacterium sp. SGL-16]|uniref:transposase n=1 Tax=Sphingobacterium sp. SGL-16 TaxID=2710883 RepID=UPI00293C137B
MDPLSNSLSSFRLLPIYFNRLLAYELLNSEEGILKRKKRCYDVEPVFGNIKQNHNFRRFMLRGKDLVSIEWG